MTRAIWLCLLAAACGSSANHGPDAAGSSDGHGGGDGQQAGDGGGTDGGGSGSAAARTVFVIPLENKDDTSIYGNTTDAPYINGLIGSGGIAAHATNLDDELALSIPSEPHYIWMEAGTNVFTDHTFTTDNDPSASNSTSSTAHLVTQLEAAGLTWTAYEEGITSGTCPIASSGLYAAKHGPFVFFQDVSGSPPSATNTGCGAHYKAIGDLATDLAAGTLPNYVFITPDLCNDMHGDLVGCASQVASSSAAIQAGDTWLSTNLPPLIAFTHSHDATIFLSWDEGSSTSKIPFIAIGDHVKPGVSSAIVYSHSSQLKTIEEIFGLPVLAAASSATDLAALFETGYLTP